MFALGLGAAFLGERLTAAAVAGAALTVVGIVILKV
jgi:drug/metabolite transporter (DMT)-like permease